MYIIIHHFSQSKTPRIKISPPRIGLYSMAKSTSWGGGINAMGFVLNDTFYHDFDEYFWPQPIRSLKLGHVTRQGSMSPTWVGRVSDPGKNVNIGINSYNLSHRLSYELTHIFKCSGKILCLWHCTICISIAYVVSQQNWMFEWWSPWLIRIIYLECSNHFILKSFRPTSGTGLHMSGKGKQPLAIASQLGLCSWLYDIYKESS